MNKNEHAIHDATEVDVPIIKSYFSGECTYATLLLLPAFELFMSRQIYVYFVNAYIHDTGLHHHFHRPLFLLTCVKAYDVDFFSADGELRKNPNLVYDYPVGRYGQEYLHMYVYECPADFHRDYDLFLKGSYSSFSPAYKGRFNKIVPTSTGEMVESPVYGILHKTDAFKKKVEKIIGARLSIHQEYFGLPVDAFEIFRYQKPDQP